MSRDVAYWEHWNELIDPIIKAYGSDDQLKGRASELGYLRRQGRMPEENYSVQMRLIRSARTKKGHAMKAAMLRLEEWDAERSRAATEGADVGSPNFTREQEKAIEGV